MKEARIIWKDRPQGRRRGFAPEIYAIGILFAATWINAMFHLG